VTQQNQTKAPLVEALEAFAAKQPKSFHVPGHKSGAVWPSDGVFTSALAGAVHYDLTELPGLDDLHAPSGPIAEAQQLAAALYGADETWFLVGGSTVGNLAAIHALCEPGDLVIADRNAHKSITNSFMATEASVVFVGTTCQGDIPLGPNVAQLLTAIDTYPHAKAIFLTRPTYYGGVIGLKEIITAAQKKNMVVVVDEAHGAHFGLHPALPQSAIQLGADLVIQSAHKMLPALTMSGMLHIRGPRAPRNKIAHWLKTFQTSSPSYLVLASIDQARKYAACEGATEIEKSIANLTAFYNKHNQTHYGDPFKWACNIRASGQSGFAVYKRLMAKQLFAEMADLTHVVFYFGLTVTVEQLAELATALDELAPGWNRQTPPQHATVPAIPPLRISKFQRTLGDNPTETLPLEAAIGRQLAEPIIPYPPGVAVLLPNEQLSEEIVLQLTKWREAGARFQGIQDETLQTVRVYIEE
jgi:arginine/lysine/ornithine decarboxylase